MPAKKNCGKVSKKTCYNRDTCVWIRLQHAGEKGFCKDLEDDFPQCLKEIKRLEVALMEYGSVETMVKHYYSNEVWQTLEDKSPNPPSNAHRRQLFLIWDMLYALHDLLKKQKEPYVAYTLPFRDFYQSKFTYVDKGYVPGYATSNGVDDPAYVAPVIPPNAKVCWVKRPLTYPATTHCKVVTYDPSKHDAKHVFFRPEYKILKKYNYTGTEAFTTPTPYMSYLTVYKYATYTDQMVKIPKILETILQLDGRDVDAGRGRQRHCVFTQTNMILNMLPYFVAHGYFIPNRLPRDEKNRKTYNWFLLAKKASVTRESGNKVRIKWPKKAANGYYVPQNVTTVENMDHFEFRNNKGEVVQLNLNKNTTVDLFVAPKKRVVYLYKEPAMYLDEISGNNLGVNNSFKLKMMRDFFNASVNNAHIIIIDEAFKEGLDLLNVAYMHLCEVVSTIGDFEQATARIARKCKSLELPLVQLGPEKNFNLRFVSIFTYESLFPPQIISTKANSAYTYNPELKTISKNGKLLCRGEKVQQDSVLQNIAHIPSDQSLALIAQIFKQLKVEEEDEKRIRLKLSLSFDNFLRQLMDIDNVAGIAHIMNEWMKSYSFDISQKDNLEKFQLGELVSNQNFMLANEQYKKLYVSTPTVGFSEESLQLPDYDTMPPYTGNIEYTDMGLGTFVFKRMKQMNNMKVLSFPGGNLLQKLRWTPPVYDEGTVMSPGLLENTQVLTKAFEALEKYTFAMVYVELAGSESHANVLVFFKQQGGVVVVERFDPNGFKDMYYSPEKLNLALQDALGKNNTQPENVTIKYVTPIDQCAFNMNYKLPGANANCVPFTVLYMDLRLRNPGVDSAKINQTLRKMWGESVLRTLTLNQPGTFVKGNVVKAAENSAMGIVLAEDVAKREIQVKVTRGTFTRNSAVVINGNTYKLQRVVGPREVKVAFMENFKNHALHFMEEVRRRVPEARAMTTASGIAEAFGRLSPERKEAILNEIVNS